MRRAVISMAATAVAAAVLVLGVQVPSGAQQQRVCSVGLVVAPGESCVYPGTSVEFSVDAGGQGRILFFSSGGSLRLRSTINGVLYHFEASKQPDGTWIIEVAGDSSASDDSSDDESGDDDSGDATDDDDEELSGVVLVVANGSSLSDVGTAASLVAASVGEEVLFAGSASALGSQAAEAVRDRTPRWVVLVGGTAALSEDIEAELRRLVPGVGLRRLAGSDRVDTAARAARLAIGDLDSVSAVIASGWSLSDVGTAASAVASGAGDVVLYAGRGELGASTAAVLSEHEFASVQIVGGTAALSEAVENQIQSAAAEAAVSRQGGSTRVHTAALFAESAFEAGADHAVVANGWSLFDVGVAAALAAADADSAVLYTDTDQIGQPTAEIITEYQPDRITLVGSTAAIADSIETTIADLAPNADITRTAEASPNEEVSLPMVRAARDGSSVVVSWDEVPGATHYKVYHDDFFDSACNVRLGHAQFCDELASRVAGTSYMHTDPDRDKNYYWVVACNQSGCSEINSRNPVVPDGPSQRIHPAEADEAARQDTVPQGDVPSVPAGLEGRKVDVAFGSDDAEIWWDPVDGATHYKVYQGGADGLLSDLWDWLASKDEWDAIVVAPETTYYDEDPNKIFWAFAKTEYRVSACNEVGCSALSESVTIE